MSLRRRPKLTPREIVAARDEVTAPATEVLQHIYQSILKTPEFTLRDGRKCKVDPFYAPEVNAAGDLKCGVDVLIDDGTHLELTVGHTGWGKSFAEAEVEKKAKRSRSR